tara:strand:+ start:1459 stop:1617 length:159 start_codon:yes stop_codon:yes gene_type:complete
MVTQSQVDNLTIAFSEFLEFAGHKDEFMKHLSSKTEQSPVSSNKKEKMEASV